MWLLCKMVAAKCFTSKSYLKKIYTFVLSLLFNLMCLFSFTLRQKTMAEGKDYCDRKTNLLKSNFDELLEVKSEIICDLLD
jgi:hypothetical protein